MPKCIDEFKKPYDTFIHPKYMIKFTSTVNELTCSTPAFVKFNQLWIASRSKYINDKDTLNFFTPQVFLAGVYNIFDIKGLIQWLNNTHNIEENTLTRVMDMVWEGLVTQDNFDEMVDVYKILFKDIDEKKLYNALERTVKHIGKGLSFHSNKSYHKIIKKSIDKK